MKKIGSIAATAFALCVASSACTTVEDSDSENNRSEIEAAAQTALEDYADCVWQSSEECSDEAEEFVEALDELDTVDGDLQFRAKSTAECTGADDVSCSGDVCVAIDDVGCGCSTGGVNTIKVCKAAPSVQPIA